MRRSFSKEFSSNVFMGRDGIGINLYRDLIQAWQGSQEPWCCNLWRFAQVAFVVARVVTSQLPGNSGAVGRMRPKRWRFGSVIRQRRASVESGGEGLWTVRHGGSDVLLSGPHCAARPRLRACRPARSFAAM